MISRHHLRYFYIFSLFSVLLCAFLYIPAARSEWTDFLQNTPNNENYYRLKKALDYYESLQTHSWPTMTTFDVPLGSRSPAVSELRECLRMTGDLHAPEDSRSEVYDKSLALAIKRFQWRHGLKADGVIGAKTLRELNVPPIERAEEIRRNIQHWAALPVHLGKRFIFINIPEYRLDLIENGKIILSMKIIVGKPDRPTPELSSTLTQVELNPYWNIPPLIAKEDILPKVIENPHYLTEENIKVVQHRRSEVIEFDASTIDWQDAERNGFNYEFRQEPGPKNALGLVKFDFANQFDVYMHDTPAKELFNKDHRTFSSGCIRLEKPFALLSNLLKNDPEWDLHHMAEALQSGKLTKIKINPVPIYIIYATAWVDQEGIVHFQHDPYGYNEDPDPDYNESQAMIDDGFAIPLSFYA